MAESKTPTRKIPRVLYASDDSEMSDVETEPIAPPVPPVEPLAESIPEPIKIPESIKKKGRPKKAPEEKAPPKKREHSPVECKYCGKKYTQGYSLDKHINDNRCYVKREQDKAEIERIKSLPPPPPPLNEDKKPKKQKKVVIESESESVVKKPRPKKEKAAPPPPPPAAPAVPLIQSAPKAKYMFKFN
jgi:hypothetical protein